MFYIPNPSLAYSKFPIYNIYTKVMKTTPVLPLEFNQYIVPFINRNNDEDFKPLDDLFKP